MSTQATVNINSARRYANGDYAAQVIVNSDAGKVFYAVKLSTQNATGTEIDLESIYQFSACRWALYRADDTLAKQLESAMKRVIYDYGHLFVKDISKARDKSVFGMWSDAIVSLGEARSMSGHTLKVDNKIFKSKDLYTLVAKDVRTIQYFEIGERTTRTLHLLEDLKLATRLLKQFDKAQAMHERIRDSKPIGFNTWDELRDSRKQAGIGWHSAKQYRKGM